LKIIYLINCYNIINWFRCYYYYYYYYYYCITI